MPSQIDIRDARVDNSFDSHSAAADDLAGSLDTAVFTASGHASSSPEVHALIARAKREWECTADALPHIVCLIDNQRRVVRINRVVEHWRLGTVGSMLGKDVHAMLHPNDCDGTCELNRLFSTSWAHGVAQEFELADVLLQRSIAVAVRPIAADNAASQVADTAGAVVAISDVTALHAARVALQTMNESLEARVRARTVELEEAIGDLRNEIARRQSAEETVRRSRNELAQLSQQLINAQESERRRISQELHDSIGQSLSAIKYSLERVAELHRKEPLADTETLLTRLVLRVKDTIAETRRIAMHLRPALLDDLGAASAIGWLCREFSETYPYIYMQADMTVSDGSVPDRLATTVFRCAQELLNNVAKHSQARNIILQLNRDDKAIRLTVADDGVGIPSDAEPTSMRGNGIRNLRERADMTGGRIQFSANANGGARVCIEWPLTPDERAGRAVLAFRS